MCQIDSKTTPQPNLGQPLVRPRRRPAPRLGGCIGSYTSLTQGLLAAHNRNCPCVQLYWGKDSLDCSCPVINESERQEVLRYCNEYNKSFSVHLSLRANLAAPKSQTVGYSRRHVKGVLTAVSELPAVCVLHIGKVVDKRSPAEGLEQVADQLNRLAPTQGRHARAPRQLLLENAAGEGTELGTTWDELRHLYEALDTSRIGLCFDTQHAFGAGMCDFSNHESVVRCYDSIDAICPKGLGLIHLNDSKVAFGRYVDSHQALGQGHIWSHNDDGLKSLLQQARDRSIDVVLETPSSTQQQDLERIRGYFQLRTK